jgi:hypothetical protein
VPMQRYAHLQSHLLHNLQGPQQRSPPHPGSFSCMKETYEREWRQNTESST